MFKDFLLKELNQTQTENGANVHKTSLSGLVDYFAMGGAKRTELDDVKYLVALAAQQDPEIALKITYYLGDVHEGMGERAVFATALNFIAKNYPNIVNSFAIRNLAEYARWDMIYALFNTPKQKEAVQTIVDTLIADYRGKTPSLCAKWMLSEKTKKQHPITNLQNITAKDAVNIVAHALNKEMKAQSLIKSDATPHKTYRIILTHLRKKINIVETKITKGNIGDINYSQVPSCAMRKYYGTFKRRDLERFDQFLAKVDKGEQKINVKDITPGQIVSDYLNREKDEKWATVAWRNLPNFLSGESASKNVLVMADVSGSMTMGSNAVKPIHHSIGLGMYFAEHNTGAFKNTIMTFSSRPEIVQLPRFAPLGALIREIARVNWGMNTNFEAALDTILKVCIKNNATPEEVPASLLVITDMEFDASIGWQGRNKNFYNAMKDKYEEKGYSIPNIIFWNVESRGIKSAVLKDQPNVQLVSGNSAKAFNSVIAQIGMTPEKAMMNIVTSKRYAAIGNDAAADFMLAAATEESKKISNSSKADIVIKIENLDDSHLEVSEYYKEALKKMIRGE